MTFTGVALTHKCTTPASVLAPVTRMNIVQPYDAPDFHSILPRSVDSDLIMAHEMELHSDHYDLFRHNKFVVFYIHGPEEEAVEYTFPGGVRYRWSGELVAFRRQNGGGSNTLAEFRPGDELRCVEVIRRWVARALHTPRCRA